MKSKMIMPMNFRKKSNESETEHRHRVVSNVLDLVQRGFFIAVAILVLYLIFGG